MIGCAKPADGGPPETRAPWKAGSMIVHLRNRQPVLTAIRSLSQHLSHSDGFWRGSQIGTVYLNYDQVLRFASL